MTYNKTFIIVCKRNVKRIENQINISKIVQDGDYLKHVILL